jgi:uncharacterized protein
LVPENKSSSISSLFYLLGIFILSWVIGNFLGSGAIILIGGLEIKDLGNLNAALLSAPQGWWAMVVGQGITSIFTFILSALAYLYFIEKKSFSDLSWKKLPNAPVFLNLLIIQLLLTPINGWIQKQNENMKLPSFLSDFEKFIKSMEENLEELTNFLTTFSNNYQLIAAILVIGVIAGIGEELLFRGLIQRKLYQFAKNHHLAIWITAFIFSAIHLQFYGFFPRMFLGALFGYFYFWTGNIWVPILAHVFNNSLAVVLLNFVNQGKINAEIEKMDNIPFPVLMTSLLLFILSVFWFYKKNELNKT